MVAGAISLPLALAPGAALIPAQAAGFPITCNALYGLKWHAEAGTSSHGIYQLNPATGLMTSVATLANVSSPLANGLANSGTAFWAATQNGNVTTTTIYKVDAATGTQTSFPVTYGPASTVLAGAINPANGNYYFGTLNTSTATAYIFEFDTATNTFIGEVGQFSIPGRVNNVSDIAFDGVGRMYFTTNSTASNAPTRLYVTTNPVPTVAGTPVLGAELLATTPVNTPPSGSIAFGADGYLYQLYTPTGELQKINPITGAVVSSTFLNGGGAATTDIADASSCAVPSTITLQKNLPDGRSAVGDQFNLAITGGGLATNNTGVTTGSQTGLQTQAPSEIAGPVIGFGGQSYTIGESAAGTTDFNNYIPSWQCVDTLNNNSVVASGSGIGGSFTMPTVPSGSNVVCTITNNLAKPGLTLVKTADRTSLVAGQTVTYTFTATNTGNVPLTNTSIAEGAFSGTGTMSGLTCNPVQPATIAPGGTLVCTATYVVTQADVDTGILTNTATATGTPPSGTPITSTNTKTINGSSSPAVTVQKNATVTDVNHNGTTDAGDSIRYSFTVTNTGNVTLSGVSVNDPFLTGLGIGVTCPSSSLAPAASETCTANSVYTITQADVDAGAVSNTATATGAPPSGPPVTSPPSTVTTPTGNTPGMSVVKGVSKIADVNGNGITDAGDQIFYNFTVTNTGNVTMSNVAVSDPLLVANSIAVTCPSSTLAPGASEVCTAASGYVITQADVDAGGVSNTATAQGTPPGSTTPVVSPPSTTSTPTASQPAISLTKTPSTNTLVAGQTITYTLVATNTGDVTLTNASIAEGSFTGAGSLSALSCNPTQPAILAPGAKLTCTATYVVTQTDVDAGSVTNSATATGTPPSGSPVSSTATATVSGTQSPALSLVKGVSKITDVNSNGITDAGDQIFYDFTVTNTGNVTIANIAVNDPLLTAKGIAVTCPSLSLAPGASETCVAAAAYVITQADVDAGSVSNTATAQGTPPGSTTPVTSPPSTATTPTADNPGLSVVKGVSKISDVNGNGITDGGDQIFYDFTVTNTGDLTMSNVAVNDPLLVANSIAVTCPSSTLAPGASEVCTAASGYVITQADVDAGSVSNTATAQGTPPGSTTPVVSPPSSTSTPTADQPAISLTKTPSTNTLVAGQTITYTLVATNTGDVTLTNASIAEGSFTGSGALSALSCNPAQPATLAPGAKLTCTATYVVTQADVDAGSITNNATVTGTPPSGSPVTATASATVPSSPTQPGISLTKTPSTNTLVAGQTITYTLVATNTGGVTLTNASIAEGSFTGSGSLSALTCNPVQPATLAPGATLTCTATYVVTQADVDAGSITNGATATGTPPSGPPVSSTATATVSGTQSPALSVVKGVSKITDVNGNGITDAGDQIFYDFNVTNTGNVTVSNVTVNDPLLSGSGIAVTCPSSSLAPGASETCVAASGYVITQADVDAGSVSNTATVQGTPPGSTTPITSPPSSTSTPTADQPAISLTKTPSTNTLVAGQTITYTLVATNTGDVTLANASIAEGSFTGSGSLSALSCNPAQPATLAPGSKLTCTATYVVTQTDVDAGSITNSATATGTPPSGPPVSSTATATVAGSASPGLSVVKGVSKIADVNGNGITDAGDQIFYNFTVTNTGNVTMSNVAVSDPLLVANSIAVTCPSSTLAPGASEVCTAASGYVITQADVDAGGVSNTATAQGTPPGSTTPVVSPPSTTSTPTSDKPAISLTKTPSTNTLVAGQTITYTLVATNTGDVTLTNASIAEGSFTGSGSLSALSCNPTQPATLAPGAKLTCTATYVVTQADVDAGTVTNSATATGTPPSGSPVTSTATATVPGTQSPSLSVVKGVSKITDVNGNGITDAGDQIFYDFNVTNTGNVTIANVAVNDPLLTAKGIAVTCPSLSLAPGASETCVAAAGYVITQADVDAGSVSNTATAQGTPPGSTTPVTSPPSTATTPTADNPGLSVVKGVSKVSDVNGNGITDGGDQIFYDFTVTNTGDLTMSNVAVNDPLLVANSIAVTCPSSSLAPGASEVCTAASGYVITQADVDAGGVSNTATAQGTPPGSTTPVVSPPSTTSTPTASQPAISLTKTPSTNTLVVGQTITYTLVATNTGDVTLTNASIAEGSFTGAGSLSALSCNPAQPATLAPGANLTCTATYVVTQADVDAGSITNNATATGTPPSGSPVTSTATATVPGTQSPSLSVVKGVSKISDVNGNGITDAGDQIFYDFNVTNSGNVTVSNVAVNDPLLSASGIAVTCPSSSLAPGASETCVAADGYVITQADVDAGGVSNTASAQGTPPGSTTPVVSPPSSTSTPTSDKPAISLTKTPSTNTLVAGQTITYTLVATNTGDVTLTNASIAEGSFTGSGSLSALSCNPAQPATLAPGATLTCTATYVVTQADVDAGSITNNATATGTPPSGSPVTSTATATVPGTQSPSLSVVKGVSKISDVNGNGITDAGDQIFYDFNVTNTGNVTIANVAVNDPLLTAKGIAVTCPSATLAPAASEVCTAASGYVITQADVDAGSVSNTATAQGTPPGSTTPVVSPPSTTSTPTADKPAISLTKTPSTNTLVVGQTITYTLVATNTGDVTLSNASIAEGSFTGSGSLSALSCNPAQPATLAPGAKLTCTATYVVTQADVDAGSITNNATATGTPPTGAPVTSTATATVPGNQSPGLKVVKRVSKIADVNGNRITDAGDRIFYDFTVTNTGNVTMGNVSVSDPLLAANHISVTCPSSSLAPGASEVCTATAGYVITQADVDRGGVSNTATAKGTPPSGPPVTSPPSTTNTPTADKPAITLVKRFIHGVDVNHDGVVDTGDQLWWTFLVTNTGDVTVHGLQIQDPVLATQGIGVRCNPSTLAPGQSVTCEQLKPYIVTATDQARRFVKNVAIGTAFGPHGVVVPSNHSSVVTPLGPPPSGSHSVLPNMGGPPLVALAAGLLATVGGLILMAGSRRRRRE